MRGAPCAEAGKDQQRQIAVTHHVFQCYQRHLQAACASCALQDASTATSARRNVHEQHAGPWQANPTHTGAGSKALRRSTAQSKHVPPQQQPP